MKENFYKLGEYKIIEDDTGQLRWEAHSGIGEFHEGKCYKKGTILFIGPFEGKGNGLLKLEFMDHLNKFPEWRKTKYYCESLDLFHCRTGRKVAREEMQLWVFEQDSERETIAILDKFADNFKNLSSPASSENITYRLQKYKLIKQKNDQIIWWSFAGPSIIKTGACIICEDILFIGPSINEQTNMSKRKFFTNINQLPIWDQTKYFCPTLSLYECKIINQVWDKKKKRLITNRALKSNSDITKHKNTNTLKSAHIKPRHSFSKSSLEILQSLPNFVTMFRNRIRFSRFNLRKPNISRAIAIFRLMNIKKLIVFSVFSILVAILFFFFSKGEDHYEKSYYKNKEYYSRHKRDH